MGICVVGPELGRWLCWTIFPLEALVAYAEAHPVIATLLLLVAMVLLGSLLRKIFKVAVVCAVVLLVGLYFTQGDDSRLVETDRSDRQ